MPTVIQLDNGKFLEVKSGTSFPITKQISDIRDFSKRTGSYSKAVKLVGSKNNIDVLSYLFDVNVIDSDFDINKKRECIVIQDGVQVFKGFFQLRKVIKKSESHTTDTDWVEFEGLVFNEISQFFNKIKNKKVNELKISDADDIHTLNRANIVNSWSHSVNDKYKYPVYYKPSYLYNGQYVNETVYQVANFKPAIYMKIIWDAIHDQAGYSYTWTSLTNTDIQFDKLLTPFNSKYEASEQEVVKHSIDIGTDLNPDPDESAPPVESFGALNYNQYTGVTDQQVVKYVNGNQLQDRLSPFPPQASIFSTTPSAVLAYMNTISNVNRDDQSQYDNTNGIFTPVLQGEHDVIARIDYKIIVDCPTQTRVAMVQNSTFPTNYLRLVFKPFARKLPLNQTTAPYIYYGEAGDAIIKDFVHGDILSSGVNEYTGTYQGQQVVDLNPDNGDTLDLFGMSFRLVQNDSLNLPANQLIASFRDDATGNLQNVTIKLEVTSINIQVKPRVTYQEGLTIDIDRFLPKGWSQSDFVKDVMTMYNLMPTVDPDDPNKIIYISRDDYYNQGTQHDLSQLVDESREKEIQFLPDLQSKFLELGYSPDKDRYNTAYQNSVGQTFGNVLVQFENEFVQGTEKKLLTASPTPTGELKGIGGYAPYIDVDEPSMKPRILYDIGAVANSTLSIQDRDGTITQPNQYGAAHHADDFNNPSFDINFGVAQYYFYPDINPTQNNLFNLHYRRLVNSINNGKLMKAWFVLDPLLVSQIDLNDTIYIDNSWWYINKLEFDGNKRNVTIMELVQIDDEQKIKFNRIVNPTPTPFPDGWGGGSGGVQSPNWDIINNDLEAERTTSDTIYGGTNDNTEVSGSRNLIQNGTSNVKIIGDNNTVTRSNTMVVGNNLNVTREGFHAKNIYSYSDIKYPLKSGDTIGFDVKRVVRILDKTEINNLFGTPITIDRDEMGLGDDTRPLYLHSIQAIVDADGTAFTGEAIMSLEFDDYKTNIIGDVADNAYYVTDGTNSSNEVTVNNEIIIKSSKTIDSGGVDSTITLIIYYKLIDLLTVGSAVVSSSPSS